MVPRCLLLNQANDFFINPGMKTDHPLHPACNPLISRNKHIRTTQYQQTESISAFLCRFILVYVFTYAAFHVTELITSPLGSDHMLISLHAIGYPIFVAYVFLCRYRWPRDLRRRSAHAWLLESRVRIC
jgi:hypothetical protein